MTLEEVFNSIRRFPHSDDAIQEAMVALLRHPQQGEPNPVGYARRVAYRYDLANMNPWNKRNWRKPKGERITRVLEYGDVHFLTLSNPATQLERVESLQELERMRR